MLVGTRLVSGVYSIGELDVVAFGESLYLFYCKWRDGGNLVGYGSKPFENRTFYHSKTKLFKMAALA